MSALLLNAGVFAPGVISSRAYEGPFAFTPDGQTIYFTRFAAGMMHPEFFVSHRREGRWSEAQRAAMPEGCPPRAVQLLAGWRQAVLHARQRREGPGAAVGRGARRRRVEERPPGGRGPREVGRRPGLAIGDLGRDAVLQLESARGRGMGHLPVGSQGRAVRRTRAAGRTAVRADQHASPGGRRDGIRGRETAGVLECAFTQRPRWIGPLPGRVSGARTVGGLDVDSRRGEHAGRRDGPAPLGGREAALLLPLGRHLRGRARRACAGSLPIRRHGSGGRTCRACASGHRRR